EFAGSSLVLRLSVAPSRRGAVLRASLAARDARTSGSGRKEVRRARRSMLARRSSPEPAAQSGALGGPSGMLAAGPAARKNAERSGTPGRPLAGGGASSASARSNVYG